MKNEACEMIKKPLSVVRVAAFCLPLALVASCGSGSEAVQGTVVNVDPANLGETGLSIEFYDSVDYSSVIRLEAKSPTGYPQIGTNILLDSAYVVYEGHPTVTCSVTQAYNSTVSPILGEIITCTAPGATPLPLPYTATTGQNGAYEVTVIYSVSPFYTGTITALQTWSGTGYNAITFTSKCLDPLSGAGRAEC